MKFWNLTRSKVRIFFHGLSRITLFIGAILMTAAVILLAIQIFRGDVDLDPDFPPSITKPEDKKSDGNVTDEAADPMQNEGSGSSDAGSTVTSGQAAPSESSPGSPSTPPPAAPSQPGQPAPNTTPPPAPAPSLLDPILDAPLLDPLQPITRPLRESIPLDPVL